MGMTLPDGAEINITIDTNGDTQIAVKGVKGGSCKDLTKSFEEVLGGVVISDTPTREMREEPEGGISGRNRNRY